MRPLICEAVLAEYGCDLRPVADVVQENVRCNLVLARRHRAGGESLECQDLVEVTLPGGGEKLDKLGPRVITEREYFFERRFSELVPFADALVAQTLRIAQLDGEDVVDYSADAGHPPAGERQLPRLGMGNEPVVPAVVLYRRQLEERLVAQCIPVDGGHTRR